MKVLYKYDDTCGLVCLLGTPSITVCRTIGRPFLKDISLKEIRKTKRKEGKNKEAKCQS